MKLFEFRPGREEPELNPIFDKQEGQDAHYELSDIPREWRWPIALVQILFGGLLAFGLYRLHIRNARADKEYAARFQALQLNHRVRAVGHTKSGSFVFVDSIASPLSFYLLPVPYGPEFGSLVAIGDTIRKEAYGKGILLKKPNGEVERYSLQKGYY